MPEFKIAFDKDLEERLDSAIRSRTVAPAARKKSDIIRSAVALYLYLQEQVSDKSQGYRVAIIDKKDSPVTIIDPLP